MMKKKHGGAAKKAEAGARMAAAHAKRMEDFSLSLGFHIMLPGYCGLRYGRPTAGTKLFELKHKSEENRLVPLKLCRHCWGQLVHASPLKMMKYIAWIVLRRRLGHDGLAHGWRVPNIRRLMGDEILGDVCIHENLQSMFWAVLSTKAMCQHPYCGLCSFCKPADGSFDPSRELLDYMVMCAKCAKAMNRPGGLAIELAAVSIIDLTSIIHLVVKWVYVQFA